MAPTQATQKEIINIDQRATSPTVQMRLTPEQIKADLDLIQNAMRSVMQKGVDYGVVPGTQKPTLLKPGAEKIGVLFRLDSDPIIEDLSSIDEIRYRIKTRVTHQVTGAEIGWGVGECSSGETKYKWVKPVCDQEFNETPADRRREKWKRGSGGNYKEKQIRPNLQDAANTILKMAKKRSLVDGMLTCTAASAIFTQDAEDLPDELRENVAERPAARPATRPATAAAAAPPPPKPTPAASAVPATDPAEFPPPPQNVPRSVIKTYLSGVTMKTAASGNPYYKLNGVEGEAWTTFSETIATKAKEYSAQGVEVEVALDMQPRGAVAVGVRPA